MNGTRKVAKNYIYNVLYQLVLVIVPIFTAPYLTRVLGADSLGSATYTITIASFISTVGLLGMQNYSIREIAYVKKDPERLQETFFELYLTRLLLFVPSCVFYLLFALITTNSVVSFLVMAPYFAAVFIDPCWFFIGTEDMGKSVARNVFAKLLMFACIFIFVKSSSDAIVYVVLTSLTTLLATVLVIPSLGKYIKFKKREVNYNHIRRHIKGSLELFWPQVAMLVYMQADSIILNFMDTASSVAFYDQGTKIVNICLSFITVMSTVLMPHLAHEFATGDKEKFNRHITQSISFSAILAFPLVFGLSIAAGTLVPWYLGSDFYPVITVIRVLSCLVLISSYSGVSANQYFVSIGQTKILTFSYTIAAVINVVLDVLLIPVLGVYGPAIATVVAQAVSMVIQYCVLLKQWPIGHDLLRSLQYLLKALPMAAVVFTIGKYLPVVWTTTLLQFIAGVGIYLLTLIITRDGFFLSLLRVLLARRER